MPFVNVNAAKLYYQFDGPKQGPVVMLSNSLASDLTMWNGQFPTLIEAGYRVLRYDGRGHGRSEVTNGPYSIERLADDARGLMDVLGIRKVHFCGLSLGGMVGQRLGVVYGDRLLSLTLCSTAAYMPVREIWDQRIDTVRKNGMAAVVDATIDRWFTKTGQEHLRAEVDRIRRVIRNTSVDGYCACGQAIRDMDQRSSLPAVTARTLIMVGEQDMGTPVSAAQFIQERIAQSEIEIFPAGAHFFHMEHAGAFNDTLLRFLARAGEGL